MSDFNLDEALRKTPQYRAALAEAMSELRAETTTPKTPQRRWRGSSGVVAPILQHCRFVQYCRDNVLTLSDRESYTMVSILARMVDGSETIHALSQAYPEYSPVVTDEKIEHALATHGPHTCAYIQTRLGFTGCPPGGCGVKSPAVIGVSTRAQQFLEVRERHVKAVTQAQARRTAVIARAQHIRSRQHGSSEEGKHGIY